MERLTYPFAVSFLKASATPNIGSAGPMGTLDQTENEYLETLD